MAEPLKIVTTINTSGLTVNANIMRVSNGYWFDDDDDTFKDSGWVDRDIAMTEVASVHGYYYHCTVPDISGWSDGEYLIEIWDTGNSVFKGSISIYIRNGKVCGDSDPVEALLSQSLDSFTTKDTVGACIACIVGNLSISGTTMTIKGTDDSTTIETYTIAGDGVNTGSRTRS